MKAHMLNVSSADGNVVSFDNLADGFALLATGQKVSYVGAAGAYTLNRFGDATFSRGDIWQIVGNDFVTLSSEQCQSTDLVFVDAP
jgi:hypothetical protein